MFFLLTLQFTFNMSKKFSLNLYINFLLYKDFLDIQYTCVQIRRSCQLARATLDYAGSLVTPGIQFIMENLFLLFKYISYLDSDRKSITLIMHPHQMNFRLSDKSMYLLKNARDK